VPNTFTIHASSCQYQLTQDVMVERADLTELVAASEHGPAQGWVRGFGAGGWD